MRPIAFLIVTLAACGEVENRGKLPDAPLPPDAASPDAPPDAAVVPCTYVAANAAPVAAMTFALTGGAFQSYNCAPIDPTYWISGSGMSFKVTFATPQARPSVRVWGMNTDDTAAVKVNGAAYPLTANSARLTSKVVCGLSPGMEGMTFSAGSLTGVNTPAQGNYSYQDLIIEQANVTSIQLDGLTGAGWGIAGASIGNCAPTAKQ